MRCISRVLFWREAFAPVVVKSGVAEPAGSLVDAYGSRTWSRIGSKAGVGEG